MAAKHLAALFAFLRFDFDLHTEVSDHKPGLLGAEITALKGFEGLRFTFGGTGSALALNLFDAPVLTTIELAFGHGCSELIKQLNK
jgi:hypothetical protein